MSLEKVDVGEYAEDDDKLKELFKQKTSHDTANIEGWQSGQPPKSRGPYDRATALVIKHNSGPGTVKIFLGEQNILTYQTHPESLIGVIMIILPASYYCWWTLDAEVKYIT